MSDHVIGFAIFCDFSIQFWKYVGCGIFYFSHFHFVQKYDCLFSHIFFIFLQLQYSYWFIFLFFISIAHYTTILATLRFLCHTSFNPIYGVFGVPGDLFLQTPCVNELCSDIRFEVIAQKITSMWYYVDQLCSNRKYRGWTEFEWGFNTICFKVNWLNIIYNSRRRKKNKDCWIFIC